MDQHAYSTTLDYYNEDIKHLNKTYNCDLKFQQDGASSHNSHLCKNKIKDLFFTQENLNLTEEELRLCKIKVTKPKGLKKEAKAEYQKEIDKIENAKSKYEEELIILNEKQFRLLQWPGNSPDLNPIELIWSFMERELGKFRGAKMTLAALKKEVIRI